MIFFMKKKRHEYRRGFLKGNYRRNLSAKTFDKLSEMLRKKPLTIEISKNLSWFLLKHCDDYARNR